MEMDGVDVSTTPLLEHREGVAVIPQARLREIINQWWMVAVAKAEAVAAVAARAACSSRSRSRSRWHASLRASLTVASCSGS